MVWEAGPQIWVWSAAVSQAALPGPVLGKGAERDALDQHAPSVRETVNFKLHTVYFQRSAPFQWTLWCHCKKNEHVHIVYKTTNLGLIHQFQNLNGLRF